MTGDSPINRYDHPDDPTLNGLVFVNESHAEEYSAIRWFGAREGQPNIVSAPGRDMYQWTTPISSLTGVPTVAGWAHEVGYRGAESYRTRVDHVNSIYTGSSEQRAYYLDVYGPNVPRMLDADQQPQATPDETLVPPEKYGMKLMSMDFLLGEDDPVIWRGPMVHKVLTQLWEDVEWGSLDYMVVDLPPGTGDTQLTLLQSVPVTGAVIVTTPQEVAIDDARKGLEMFGEHETPVLGVVENMSSFRCPDCGSEHAIFGEGGGEAFAGDAQMPFLGEIPLDPAIREGGDAGEPMVLDEGSETGEALRSFVRNTADNQGIVHRRRHADTH